jgi:hypothetical protein
MSPIFPSPLNLSNPAWFEPAPCQNIRRREKNGNAGRGSRPFACIMDRCWGFASIPGEKIKFLKQLP